jgi:Fur family peroxide stress response transcriptional regulator
MRSGADIEKRLKASGLRMTPQRRAVLGYLAGNTQHPSARDIFLGTREHLPMLSFATVYNTLKVLEELGEVQTVRVGGNKTHYDPRTDLHGHFYCQKCGNVVDIETEEMPPPEISGHRVEGCRTVCFGVCVDCRRSQNG